jgi:hypothetical protein
MRLYWEYFRDLKVCLPPVVEQKAILERIGVGALLTSSYITNA